MSSSIKLGYQAAAHLLEHPELADRASTHLADLSIDWPAMWNTPPWSTREERVLRAAAEVSSLSRPTGMAPLRLAELMSSKLWDPRPFNPGGEDHSHRVLEAMAIRRGLNPDQARVWLAARYDAIARALDVWEWGALSTDVDAATHVLTSRTLTDRARHHLFGGGWPRVFEALDAETWDEVESVMVEAARALCGCGEGPTIRDVTTRLDDEQLAVVIEALYIAWYHGA